MGRTLLFHNGWLHLVLDLRKILHTNDEPFTTERRCGANHNMACEPDTPCGFSRRIQGAHAATHTSARLRGTWFTEYRVFLYLRGCLVMILVTQEFRYCDRV